MHERSQSAAHEVGSRPASPWVHALAVLCVLLASILASFGLAAAGARGPVRSPDPPAEAIDGQNPRAVARPMRDAALRDVRPAGPAVPLAAEGKHAASPGAVAALDACWPEPTAARFLDLIRVYFCRSYLSQAPPSRAL